jgi:hypothetical protein
MQNDSALAAASKRLIGPNIATGDWTPEMVWNTGFVQDYAPNLAALAVQHYVSSYCFADVSAQDIFHEFLIHTGVVEFIQPYLNSAGIAQAAGIPFMMQETNSASCGGIPGISDSFGAALWAIDYALQMAYSNFSGAFFHISGQNATYNAFTGTFSSIRPLQTVTHLLFFASSTPTTLG